MSGPRWPGLVPVLAALAACGDNVHSTKDARSLDARVDAAVADALAADAPVADARADARSDAGAVADGPSLDARTADASIDAMIDAMPDAATIAGGPPLGACRSGWCWVYPLPQGNALHGIWGASASDVWVLGDHSTLVHYDGAGWTEYASNSPGWGRGGGQLWGTASNDVWAAATTAGVLHWNGSAWSVSGSAGAANVIGGTGADDVWTFDAKSSRILQWDGASWTSHRLPAAGWRPIAFGGAPGSLLVVSAAGGIAKWVGNAWGITDTGSHPANAACVIDASHIVVAQDGGAVSFWDGNGWTTRTAPVPASWKTITATSFSDVWVTGNLSDATSYRYHWNGAAWSAADDPGDTGWPQALWVDASGEPWAAMSDAEVRVWDGNTWTRKTVGDNYVQAVGGTAEDDIWIVSWVYDGTPRNRVTHWNGSAWSEAAFPYDTTYTLGRIWGSAGDDYWIAAGHANGNVVDRMMIHWNGNAWTAMGPYGTEDAVVGPTGFTAVWGAAQNDVYAVARTALYHYDGNAWTVVTAVPGGSDVFGTSSADVYVIYGQQLWHWNGSAWSAKTMPSSGDTLGWINAPNDVWIAGGSAGLHYDGAFFVQYVVYMPTSPVGSATHMFTYGFANGVEQMIEWVGGLGGTTSTSQAFFLPEGGWHAPDGHVYAAGSGLLVH